MSLHSAEYFMCMTLFKTHRNDYSPHFTHEGRRFREGKASSEPKVAEIVGGGAEVLRGFVCDPAC